MICIEVIEKNKSVKLCQWDADRYIKISAPEGIEVSHADFAHEHDPKAIRREVTLSDGIMTAKIPNSLLQRCGKMRVWLVCDDVTIHGDFFVVTPKTRDEGYVLPDDEDEVYNYTNLEKRIEELEKDGGGISEEVFEEEIRKLSEDIADLKENGTGGTTGTGLSAEAKGLLITILKNAVYSTNQSNNIILLENALAAGSDDSGGEDSGTEATDETITQSGNIVTIGKLATLNAVQTDGTVEIN